MHKFGIGTELIIPDSRNKANMTDQRATNTIILFPTKPTCVCLFFLKHNTDKIGGNNVKSHVRAVEKTLVLTAHA